MTKQSPLRLDQGDRVTHNDVRGTVTKASGNQVRVEFDDDTVGVFDRVSDPRLSIAATEAQWQDQANAVALFAEALNEGRVPPEQRWSAVKRLKDSVDTLLAWTDRPA